MMITDRQWTAISYFSTQCISFITYPVGNTRNRILPISALTTLFCWLQGMLSEVWLRVCKTMSHSVGAYSQSVMSKSWGKSRLLIVWLFLAQLAEGRIITHEKMSVCLSVSVSVSVAQIIPTTHNPEWEFVYVAMCPHNPKTYNLRLPLWKINLHEKLTPAKENFPWTKHSYIFPKRTP